MIRFVPEYVEKLVMSLLPNTFGKYARGAGLATAMFATLASPAFGEDQKTPPSLIPASTAQQTVALNIIPETPATKSPVLTKTSSSTVSIIPDAPVAEGFTPAAATEVSTTETPAKEIYERMTSVEAGQLSDKKIVLLVGENLQDVEGVVDFLKQNGLETTVVFPDRDNDPRPIDLDSGVVFANKAFGGLFNQDDINRGYGADIKLFAINKGVPVRQTVALESDNLTAGL